MSVTFWIPAAETKPVQEECLCGGGWAECPHCHGKGTLEYRESMAPTLNLGNVNARSIIDLIGLPDDQLVGQVEGAEIGTARQRILAARNMTRKRRVALRDTIEYGGAGTGHCRVVECGYTDEQVLDRLSCLDAVLAWAQEHQMKVSWS